MFKIFSINQTLLLLFGFETFLIRNGENGKHIVEMGFRRQQLINKVVEKFHSNAACLFHFFFSFAHAFRFFRFSSFNFVYKMQN